MTMTSIHPQLPTLLLALIVGGLVYAMRRWRPHAFERLPRSLQSLPATLIAAALAAVPVALGQATLADAARMTVEAVLVAIGGHHAIAKWILPQPEQPS